MSLRTFVAELTTDVFADTEYFAETATLYPGGDRHYPTNESITVVFDEDLLEGVQENVRGDGRQHYDRNDKKIRDSVYTEIAATANIDETRSPPDMLQVGTTFYNLKRILGKDHSMMLCHWVKTDHIITTRTQKRG